MDEDIQSTESLAGKRIRRKMLRSWSGEIAYIIEEEESSDYSSALPDKADTSDKRKLLNPQQPSNKTNISTDYARIEFPATKHNFIPGCGKFEQWETQNNSNKHKYLKKLHSAGTNTEGPTNVHVCNHCKKYRTNNENSFKEYVNKKLSNTALNATQEKPKQTHTERGMSKAYYATKSTNTPNKRQAVGSKTHQYNEKPKIDCENEDEHLSFVNTPRNTRKTSVCANLGKALNQFVGGTLDAPVLMANTNLQSNDRKDRNNNYKSPHHRKKLTDGMPSKAERHTSFTGIKEDDEGIIKILPPLLQPPISSYSKKCEEDARYDKRNNISVPQKESDKISYPSPMALISERKSCTSNNELCEQRRFRNSLKNEFEIIQEPNLSRYPTKSQNSNFSSNVKSMNVITETNRKRSQTADNKDCAGNYFQPSIRTQAVDFTPFLTQLLESCLKIPYVLNNIRSANNTFVSDLQKWKMNTQNLINKGNVNIEKNDKSDYNNNNQMENDDCTICNHCHKELETMLQMLNKTQPTSDNLQNKYKPCNCASNLFARDDVLFSTPNQLPTYLAQCHIPYHHKMQSEILAKIHQMQKLSKQRCRGCDITNGLNESELIRNQNRKPRCAFIKEESSDEGESDCSHCSSCSSLLESNY
ncbi:uncharacterized protein LOC112127506 [Cimex lectularius]|uniref:Uncharacterized protein n=1 Tax=Cimex lectularius TaxID=79782 RepID=A0A8I6TML0_CIMLE|nr:uncharacterized protein LOC112127506 [Cimex lectularius]